MAHLVSFLPVEPIGERTARGFQCRSDGSTVHEWSEPAYPPHPHGAHLRETRLRLDLGIREAATVLEIRSSELSALENGRATLADEQQWVALESLLAAHKEPR